MHDHARKQLVTDQTLKKTLSLFINIPIIPILTYPYSLPVPYPKTYSYPLPILTQLLILTQRLLLAKVVLNYGNFFLLECSCAVDHISSLIKITSFESQNIDLKRYIITGLQSNVKRPHFNMSKLHKTKCLGFVQPNKTPFCSFVIPPDTKSWLWACACI